MIYLLLFSLRLSIPLNEFSYLSITLLLILFNRILKSSPSTIASVLTRTPIRFKTPLTTDTLTSSYPTLSISLNSSINLFSIFILSTILTLYLYLYLYFTLYYKILQYVCTNYSYSLYGSFLYVTKPIYSNHIYDTHLLFIFPILIENQSTLIN